MQVGSHSNGHDIRNCKIACYRCNNRNTREDIMELVKIICAILLPPLGVFLQVGLGKHFWINIILTLFGYIPGIVHAIWVVAKNK